jgi:class 3 adenylate cyclase
MTGTRKIAAILVADIVGYSRLAGTDEDRTLSRLRGLRSDLIDRAVTEKDGTDRMSRVVLSGHSVGIDIEGAKFKNHIYFSYLVDLAKLFPKAAGQTKHLEAPICQRLLRRRRRQRTRVLSKGVSKSRDLQRLDRSMSNQRRSCLSALRLGQDNRSGPHYAC